MHTVLFFIIITFPLPVAWARLCMLYQARLCAEEGKIQYLQRCDVCCGTFLSDSRPTKRASLDTQTLHEDCG